MGRSGLLVTRCVCDLATGNRRDHEQMGTDIDPARIGQCVPVVMTFRTVPIQPVVCSVLDNIQHRRHFQIWLPFITEIKECEVFQKIVASSSIGDIYISTLLGAQRLFPYRSNDDDGIISHPLLMNN